MEQELLFLKDRASVMERELSIKEEVLSKIDQPTSVLITDIEKYKREFKNL
jgi:hypothetical protein